jgi:hypothetical protein
VRTLDATFAALATTSCPHYAEMLIALEREFRAVDREAIDRTLDDLARPLFVLATAPPDEQVAAVTSAAWTALPDEASAPSHWLLAASLEAGRAPGTVRAALAIELGRRAGLPGVAGDVCGHQLAFAVLSGLGTAWKEAGDRRRAQRAYGLRLLLPLGEELQARVRFEIQTLAGMP